MIFTNGIAYGEYWKPKETFVTVDESNFRLAQVYFRGRYLSHSGLFHFRGAPEIQDGALPWTLSEHISTQETDGFQPYLCLKAGTLRGPDSASEAPFMQNYWL
jgi:hypothetical protein